MESLAPGLRQLGILYNCGFERRTPHHKIFEDRRKFNVLGLVACSETSHREMKASLDGIL